MKYQLHSKYSKHNNHSTCKAAYILCTKLFWLVTPPPPPNCCFLSHFCWCFTLWNLWMYYDTLHLQLLSLSFRNILQQTSWYRKNNLQAVWSLIEAIIWQLECSNQNGLQIVPIYRMIRIYILQRQNNDDGS